MELKFKAWDKKKKEMIFDGVELEIRCLSYPDSPKRKAESFIGYGELHYQHFDLMQYTGLDDATDTEGYHKDLVLFDFIPDNDQDEIDPTRVGMIEWSNDGGVWIVVDKEGIYLCDLWDCFKQCNGKIIGNKFQDSELLTKG